MSNNFSDIEKKIQKGGEISPFLFLSSNLEILHHELESYLLALLQERSIDKQSLFHLKDNGENLKISEVKQFIAQGEVKSRFAFQVFFIEDVSRMTQQAQNACLKFFEEPGEGNIIILTSQGESGILDTILSRVQIHGDMQNMGILRNEFYNGMIEKHISKASDELIRYFFSGKYEKQEYVTFLKSLISFISESGTFTYLLDDIHEDINGIIKNNLQGKYIVDKYIMLLRKY